ncbi:MAG: formylglycine-generating enzyme family protein [Planctomycetes bacterium]|nr:formylglycine-generating enzyme family protein [Planctomycetota bacterium]
MLRIDPARFVSLTLLLILPIACRCTDSERAPRDGAVPETTTTQNPPPKVQEELVQEPTPPATPASYTEHIPGAEPETPFDMVWIEAGHFWIGKTEVTWDEYLRYCNFDRKETLPEDLDAVTRPSKPLETFPYDYQWGTGKRPAVGMSWNAAKKYCQWLSLMTGHEYRLPTETEWELAAGKAPEGPIGEYAWYIENSDEKTQEVGQKKPNEHGLYDVLGNLWEYTADPFDPAEPNWAALRGGSWELDADELTPTARLKFDEFWNMDDSNNPPGVWWVPEGYHLGFRVLREGPVTTPSNN